MALMHSDVNATYMTKGARSHKDNIAETEANAETKTEVAHDQAKPENVVVFTSHDGTVREVGDLPSNLGRATALASEKAISKIWGTSEEEAACHDMRKGI